MFQDRGREPLDVRDARLVGRPGARRVGQSGHEGREWGGIRARRPASGTRLHRGRPQTRANPENSRRLPTDR